MLTAAPASDFHRIQAPKTWGYCTICNSPEAFPVLLAPRAYDNSGRTLYWTDESLAFKRACDFENHETDVSWMASRYHLTDDVFLKSWVCTEVAAKLFDLPILVFLKKNGLFKLNQDYTSFTCIHEGKDVRAEIVYINSTAKQAHIALGRFFRERQ
ncbi:hypothetical protein Ctha_0370 [Chloroherpeton thalassium ATCC 35110]|uniref:Uncharacterized protein n=1 Tax=Chloroherpeton thalassium (strain ATCC 35110 / GB-78) TaxID=517418 RepID=B3QU43_CHLT3|nr:hypothetical protein [Chloroherpeton thalassium]ACF12841.1 hypothetical protein Ctha_0370 [Chloroherpeton thalassium ATCC 35110]